MPQHLRPPLILYSLATENIGQSCISQRFVFFEQCPPTNLLFLLFICIDSPLQKCGQKRFPGVGIHHSPRHATSYPYTLHNFGDHRLHTDGERRFLDRRSCWPLHNFDEHRLRTHGDRRFIDRRSCWPLHNFDDHRLRTHEDHRFIDRRSCWPCITSATTDYTRNAASSIGDHVDLWRTPLYQPAIMLTFAYLRRPPTTHAWKSPFHRPTIMLTFA